MILEFYHMVNYSSVDYTAVEGSWKVGPVNRLTQQVG